MTRAIEWDRWYSEFAEAWRPMMQSFLDSHPEFHPSGLVWTIERQWIELSPVTVECYRRAMADDISWCITALQHGRQKWFVAQLAALAGSVPEALFEPMLLAGIEADDPSLNSRFVRPCVQAFGVQRVKEYLLSMTASPDPRRVVGALDAMYWTGGWEQTARHVLEHRNRFLLEALVSESCSDYLRGRLLLFLERDGLFDRDTDDALVARAREVKDAFERSLGFSSGATDG